MQPGWYPDPYSSGALRWWDGQAWTEHIRPGEQLMAAWPSGSPTPDVGRDLAAEQRWARVALVAIWVVVAIDILGYVLIATTFAHDLNTFTNNLNKQARRLNSGQSTNFNLFPAPWRWLLSVGLFIVFGFLALLPMQIWLRAAARISRNFGVPARREPYWGILGFYLPIVNFWFPYQVARDVFGIADPRRTLVGQWWAAWLVRGIWGEVVLTIAQKSETAGVVAAVVSAAVPAVFGWLTRRVILHASAMHREWAGR
jgi:hypothetical protein